MLNNEKPTNDSTGRRCPDMENRRKNSTVMIAVAGVIILAVILIGGTVLMGRSAQKDTTDAVRSVSLLYLV